MEKYDLAVTYFDRHFKLARGVVISKIENDDNGGEHGEHEHKPTHLDDGAPSPDANTDVATNDTLLSPTSSTVASASALGVAQVQLGLSRANAGMRRFFSNVATSGFKAPPFSTAFAEESMKDDTAAAVAVAVESAKQAAQLNSAAAAAMAELLLWKAAGRFESVF